MKKLMISIAIGAMVLAGCMTSPLVSSDPAVRKQAVMAINDDKELFFIAMNLKVGIKGQWPELYPETHIREGEFPDDVRVAAVERLKNMDYLLICASWNDGDEYIDPGYEYGKLEYGGKTHYCQHDALRATVNPGNAVRNAAVTRLSDFTTFKAATKSLDAKAEGRLLPKSPAKVARGASSNGNAFIDVYGHMRPGNPLDKALLTAMGKLKQPTAATALICNAADGGQGIAAETFTYAMRHLDGVTPQDASLLFKKVFVEHHDNMYTKKEWLPLLLRHVDELDAKMAEAALRCAANEQNPDIVKKIKSAEAAMAVLDIRRGYSNKLVIGNPKLSDPKQVATLLGYLDDNTVREVASAMLNKVDKYNWNSGDTNPFLVIAELAATSRGDTALNLSSAILKKIDALKKECGESVVGWRGTDDKKAADIVTMLPLNRISPESLGKLIVSCGEASRYVLPAISSESARNLLLSGDAKSDDLEVGLVGRIPPEQLDIALYRAVKSAKGKKAVMDAMPQAQKELAKKEQAKEIGIVWAKSKAAAKETLAYNGFYLGMSFEDAKAMFVHHFPELQFEEGIDGKGNDADYCIYAPGQSNPFCFASVKDGKVYQFNFGKRLLKKWCKYDASTIRDWAKAFGREHGLEMKLDFINRDGEVYTMSGNLEAEPHYVSLHQEIWTYKNGAKNYRLTYFGERKIQGNGPVITGLAREKWKYISADEGTLRIVIDNN